MALPAERPAQVLAPVDRNARDEVADLIADNPSLKSMLDEVVAKSYRYVRRKAAIETNLGEERFPGQCPWSFAEAIDEGFLPE
jgi:hypothetical protein